MKYVKPELKFERIQIETHIASAIGDWLIGEQMEDAQVTAFYVAKS